MRHYLRIVSILALANFCFGVAEFLVPGILTYLSLFYGVSDSQVGNLVTLYTLGVMVGVPIISVLFSRFNYRNQLVFALTLFALSHLFMFFSHSFLSALIARFLGGLMHGLFFVIATVICLKVAPKAKKSMALGLLISGFLIALAMGVPLTIWVSKHFGLLTPFLLIACMVFLAAFVALLTMPKFSSQPANFKNLGVVFHFTPVWQSFLVTAFACGSMSVVYIYLRVLLERHHFSPESIAEIYVYYGIAGLLGHFLAIKLTDLRGSFAALSFLLTMEILVLGAMHFSYHLPKAFLATNVIVFGFFSCALVVPFKTLCIHLAHVFTPHTSSNDTIALNEAAFFKGMSVGSFVGGLIVHYFNVNFNSICAALFALCALLILRYGIKKPVFTKSGDVAPPKH
ncbi:MFS transporter [Helicobacter sp. NHP19-003]|uniref:MFS transporter n=1 Tax=Helicobacter gastrocanis TaxID=2849641 RepID=A0ABN6I265_9HELI|nr:MFS transporter [Helicobacter sp. NHP19-003]BCZ17672.1 MFS transporter [Helicobacter sp. NHP19-003]